MTVTQKFWLGLLAGVTAMTAASSPTLGQQQAPAATYSPAQTKALEDMSYAIALNAATWGSPIVTMYALRYLVSSGTAPKLIQSFSSRWPARRQTFRTC